MPFRTLILMLLIAGYLCVNQVNAGDTLNNVDFQPAFNPATGLELHVQNFSKLPKTLASVDVFVGGTEEMAACHAAVPEMTLAPAARESIVVTDAKTLNSCLPAKAPARRHTNLAGLENIPLKSGASNPARLPIERSVRIVPRFAGADAAETAPRQLRFRLAN